MSPAFVSKKLNSSPLKGCHVVVVESPGKVKTISQYLGKNYQVLATYGHIRSLPSKSGAVRPEDDFAMTWMVLEKAEKALQPIVKSLKEASSLILATDLDREGEAIAWHLLEYLRSIRALPDHLKIERVSFNAITKSEVLSAIQNPRVLNQDLVHAYLARLSLDYLVGFTLSPVLWTKLPGARSAGRVQSVALRLIVEREQSIEAFISEEYWSLHGNFSLSPNSPSIQGQLYRFSGEKLEKLSIPNGTQAEICKKELEKHLYRVEDIQKKTLKRNPSAPFKTASLQQEASRKLGFSPSRCMSVAQKLYEGITLNGEVVGLITYMRTDSVSISPEALAEQRKFIQEQWGKAYLPPSARRYSSKNRTQEAHEAIRPSNIERTPESLKPFLSEDEWRLYKLIWERTLAAQMESATLDQQTVLIESQDCQHAFRTTFSKIIFDGFLTLYEESQEEESGPKETLNVLLQKGEALKLEDLESRQHFTQPPARYSEASLVQEMEDLGIGRPSTYARILHVLQERDYVLLEKRRLVPTERGKIVTHFLCRFFSHYVDYQFTAQMEDQLDEVCEQKRGWKDVLKDFWPAFFETAKATKNLSVAQVLLDLQEKMFPIMPLCPTCQHALSLKLGKTGPYLACSAYPACTYSQELSGEHHIPILLGQHPEKGGEVWVKKGPYGWYIQHDQQRNGLPSDVDPENLSLEHGLWLLSLPLTVGLHPETESPITVSIGRFGPYLKHQDQFYALRKYPNYRNLSLQEALDIIQKESEKPKTPRRIFSKKNASKTPSDSKKEKKSSSPKPPSIPKSSKKRSSRASQSSS